MGKVLITCAMCGIEKECIQTNYVIRKYCSLKCSRSANKIKNPPMPNLHPKYDIEARMKKYGIPYVKSK
jgi:hypothetical protein